MLNSIKNKNNHVRNAQALFLYQNYFTLCAAEDGSTLGGTSFGCLGIGARVTNMR